MRIESGRRKIINHDFVQGQGNPPSCQDLQRPRLGKPRRGMQILDTRVDFPVPVQSPGRFLYSYILQKLSGTLADEGLATLFPLVGTFYKQGHFWSF